MSLRKTALLSIASGLVFIGLGGITNSTSFASTVTPKVIRGSWYNNNDAGIYKFTVNKRSISQQLGSMKLKGKKGIWKPSSDKSSEFQKHTYSVASVKKVKDHWVFKCKAQDNWLYPKGKFTATFKLKKSKGKTWLTSSMFGSAEYANYSRTIQFGSAY